jgi:glycerol-3-phosphate responsive antiterminator
LGHLTRWGLPSILVAEDGRHPSDPPPGIDAGVLLRDTDLAIVVARCAVATGPLALDIDTVRGLGTDEAAVAFVVQRLGIEIVLTRRPATAAAAAALGGLALVHVLAFDSTGMTRSLDGHPRTPGVGAVVSPGLVLSHMTPAELDRIPRPILGYGLISEPADVAACLRLADGVVLRPEPAARFARAVSSGEPAVDSTLTTVGAEE